jgi:hypothetical protein
VIIFLQKTYDYMVVVESAGADHASARPRFWAHQDRNESELENVGTRRTARNESDETINVGNVLLAQVNMMSVKLPTVSM